MIGKTAMQARVAFRVDKGKWKEFTAFATAAGLTFSELIRLAVEAVLEVGKEVSNGKSTSHSKN